MWTKILSFAFFFMLCVGCRFLDISDDEINQIGKVAGDTATVAITSATSPFITPGAGAGVGAIGGLLIAGGLKGILSLLQKKKTTTP